MMVHDELKKALIYMWQEPIFDAYQAGLISNERMLEAELYRALQGQGYPPWKVWLAPNLHFAPHQGILFDHIGQYQHKQWLTHQQPAMLITQAEEVVGVVEISFSPDGYVDSRRKLRRMMSLYQLGGEAKIALQIHPHNGHVDTDAFYLISDSLLCAFAVITKKGSFGLQTQTLLKEFHDLTFQAHFLHLTGSVRPEKIVFGHHSPEFG